jgi:hypothetical protein
MNQNLLYILIIAVFIYIVLDNCKETFYETFMPQDPSYYIDSCRRLSQEQKIVKKLQTNVCNKNTNDTSKRNPINNSINCHNFVEKEIMLNNEQTSWCSRITPEQLSLIEKELGTKVIPIDGNTTPSGLQPSLFEGKSSLSGLQPNLFEGPLFLENDFKNNAAYDKITANYSSI